MKYNTLKRKEMSHHTDECFQNLRISFTECAWGLRKWKSLHSLHSICREPSRSILWKVSNDHIRLLSSSWAMHHVTNPIITVFAVIRATLGNSLFLVARLTRFWLPTRRKKSFFSVFYRLNRIDLMSNEKNDLSILNCLPCFEAIYT